MLDDRARQQAEQLKRHQEQQAESARLEQMGVQGYVSVDASEWEVHQSKSAPHQPIVSRRPASSFPVWQPQLESKGELPREQKYGNFRPERQPEEPIHQFVPDQLQGNRPREQKRSPEVVAQVQDEKQSVLPSVPLYVATEVEEKISAPLNNLINLLNDQDTYEKLGSARAAQIFETAFERAASEYKASQNRNGFFNQQVSQQYLKDTSATLKQTEALIQTLRR